MRTQDIILLLFFVSVFAAFGITLAFASWDETRIRTGRKKSAAPRASSPRLDLAQGVRAR